MSASEFGSERQCLVCVLHGAMREGCHRVSAACGGHQRPLGRQQPIDADGAARVNARRRDAHLCNA